MYSCRLIVLDGARLTDTYPAAKVGRRVAGEMVIILDRLCYDLATNSFGLLPGIPKLPNNLDATLILGKRAASSIARSRTVCPPSKTSGCPIRGPRFE